MDATQKDVWIGVYRDVVSYLRNLLYKLKGFSASNAQCCQKTWRSVEKTVQIAEHTGRYKMTTESYVYVLYKYFETLYKNYVILLPAVMLDKIIKCKLMAKYFWNYYEFPGDQPEALWFLFALILISQEVCPVYIRSHLRYSVL